MKHNKIQEDKLEEKKREVDENRSEIGNLKSQLAEEKTKAENYHGRLEEIKADFNEYKVNTENDIHSFSINTASKKHF